MNGVEEFYQTVQGAIPSIVHLIQNGHAPSTSIFAALIGPVLYFILNFVWRFVTDPISHACWAGLTGYIIGLVVTGKYRWYQVAWIGLVVAAILHGFNDWSQVNGHFACSSATRRSDPARTCVAASPACRSSCCLIRLSRPSRPSRGMQPVPHAQAPREPAGSRRGRPWWEH